MSLKDSGAIELKGQHEIIPQDYIGLNKDTLVSYIFHEWRATYCHCR